ncbi:hypothetical protein PsYK624_123560 [Phanerochaete sordida]|uniref:Uncharacterized protein n=1 Tax=Phanerochaete sordida TaxID=48140 RepID=A0A9P3LIH4_9APHY|nr:hypothetical protein PsYK624_123560 [Phanerochaete sordida]
MPPPPLPATRPQDSLPVLSIELSHRVDEPLIDQEELERRLRATPRTPPNASPLSSVSTLSSRMPASPAEYPDTSPVIHGVSELSTILEADTSGISKHLPDLDDTNPSAFRPSRSPHPSAKSLVKNASDAQDYSALDLSTSDLNNEVLAALSDSGPKGGWGNGVVVEDSPVDAENANVTFNLGALDPDLAALLSPTSRKATEPTMLMANDAFRSPPRSPLHPRSKTSTPPSSPHSRDVSQGSSTLTPVGRRSTSLPRPTQPISPSRIASLSKATSSKIVAPSTASRLMRSPSERPSPSTSERAVDPSSSIGRTSLQLPRARQSPLLAERTTRPRTVSTGSAEQESRKPALSRLTNPARHLASSGSLRAGLRLYATPQSSPGHDGTESVTSHSPSAMSSSVGRRLNGVRPSLDVVGERPRAYSRARSSSLDEGSPYDAPTKRPIDWLGPRTAKAFAAAGLLDGDHESAAPSGSRPTSRFGTSRSDRDFRSHYTPSRAGFSDLGSSSSWGRRSGSISRNSESVLGTPLSDSASTPRTTFSASTAPTSVSSSSMQRHLQDELSSLQEKHSLETGALLSALSDSQRTTRVLREENAQLRDRLQYAEEQLAAAREELQRQQFAQTFNPPSTSTLGRSSLYRLAGQSATELPRRGQAPSRLQTLLRASADDLRLEDLTVAEDPNPKPLPHDSTSYAGSHRRRGSGSSSIFPPVPSNMTMLLHDDAAAPENLGTHSSVSGSPRSAAMALGKTISRPPLEQQGAYGSHAPHYSVSSSAGNISPTTACFSMMTGSPGSLRLQPEHEVLLGDMPSLDLHAPSEDVHEFYPRHGL